MSREIFRASHLRCAHVYRHNDIIVLIIGKPNKVHKFWANRIGVLLRRCPPGSVGPRKTRESRVLGIKGLIPLLQNTTRLDSKKHLLCWLFSALNHYCLLYVCMCVLVAYNEAIKFMTIELGPASRMRVSNYFRSAAVSWARTDVSEQGASMHKK